MGAEEVGGVEEEVVVEGDGAKKVVIGFWTTVLRRGVMLFMFQE